MSQLRERSIPSADYKFPTIKGRKCQSKWFTDYDWLHYHDDKLYCFVCLKAAETGNLSQESLRKADGFSKNGFVNFNHVYEGAGLSKHQSSNAHTEAKDRLNPKNRKIHDSVQGKEGQKQRENNRKNLLKHVFTSSNQT